MLEHGEPTCWPQLNDLATYEFLNNQKLWLMQGFSKEIDFHQL